MTPLDRLLAPTEVKLQHIVPRLLQTPFSAEGLIHVYDLEMGKCFRTSVDNVGATTRFYDLRMGLQSLSAEGWLSAIESAVAPILKKLVANPTEVKGLSEAEERTLALFACVQDFRNHSQRNLFERIRRQLADHARKVTQAAMKRQLGEVEGNRMWQVLYADEPDGYWLAEKEHYQPSLGTAQLLAEATKFAEMILRMPWKVGIVPESLPLYLSDNGISRLPVPSERWAVFFEHAYYLPLSPRTLLRIGPGLTVDDAQSRRAVIFSGWEAVFANALASQGAERFLLGTGPFLDRQGVAVHTKTC